MHARKRNDAALLHVARRMKPKYAEASKKCLACARPGGIKIANGRSGNAPRTTRRAVTRATTRFGHYSVLPVRSAIPYVTGQCQPVGVITSKHEISSSLYSRKRDELFRSGSFGSRGFYVYTLYGCRDTIVPLPNDREFRPV